MKICLTVIFFFLCVFFINFWRKSEVSVGAASEIGTINKSLIKRKGELTKELSSEEVLKESRLEFERQFATTIEDFGKGADRNEKLLRLFADSTAPLITLVDKLSKLDNALERSSAMRGLSIRIIKEGNLDDIVNLIEESDEVNLLGVAAITNGLVHIFEVNNISALGYWDFDRTELAGRDDVDFDKVIDVFVALRKLGGDGPQFDARLGSLVKSAMRKVPFDVWNSLADQNSEIYNLSDDDGLRDNAVRWMFYQNPHLALSEISSIQKDSPEVGDNLLSIGVSAWFEKDSKVVYEWLDKNYKKLDYSSRQVLAKDIAYRRSKDGEQADAYKWIAAIDDPAIRAEVKITVEKNIRNKVIEDSRLDPVQAIESIGGGNGLSGYRGLIGDIFSDWTLRDENAAANWFDSAQQTLSQSVVNEVATVYFEQARQNGDVDLAKQWINSISSEELRDELYQKIDSSLKK